ncbi:MAG: LPXTG cell wall anchor domain-containing protein [Solirubrobacteraceae bacterium]
MSRPRHLLACLIVLGLLALVSPAASMAACGGSGSAGDQQYVDPLAHCHRGSSPSSATTPAASAPAPTTPSSPVTPAASTATATTPSTAPTATTAAGRRAKAGASLPYTGLDARLIVALGLALVLGGFVLRRATRDRRRRFYIR